MACEGMEHDDFSAMSHALGPQVPSEKVFGVGLEGLNTF